MHFVAMKKSTKRSGLGIYSYFKDSAVSAVKETEKFYARYVKGVPRAHIRYIQRGGFFLKNGIKKKG